MATITPADILDEAARVLDEDGWTQGVYHDDDTGERCAVGALISACGGLDWLTPNPIIDETVVDGTVALTELARYIGLPSTADIEDWNDEPGRQQHEVIDALRHTAKHLRGGA